MEIRVQESRWGGRLGEVMSGFEVERGRGMPHVMWMPIYSSTSTGVRGLLWSLLRLLCCRHHPSDSSRWIIVPGSWIILPASSYRGREKEVARSSCSPLVGGCGLTKVVRPYALVVCSLEQVTRNWRECQVVYIASSGSGHGSGVTEGGHGGSRCRDEHVHVDGSESVT